MKWTGIRGPHIQPSIIPRLCALGIFVLALYLRTAGLSHDLHLEQTYHPDTLKQIRAAERFLKGEYYTVMGSRDHEGYPYFNSHIVEYMVRGYAFLRTGIRHHLGLPHTDGTPSDIALYWITRLLNATLSALAAVLIFFMGDRHASRGAGVMGGLFLALSPTDITAAHFATGDVTAAFFAVCSVWFALQIAREPRIRAYIFAAFFAAAAFSTKYHGGIAILAAGLAHLYAYPRARLLFSRPAIVRAGVMALSLLAGVLLTSSALLVYPKSALRDIFSFIEHTSSFAMTREMLEASLPQRFLMGMSLNMPVLLDVLGLVIAVAAIAAFVVEGRRRSVWIIAIVPFVYILGGLAAKPLAHPVYHTMATPFIMLLAGITLDRLYRMRFLAPLGRMAALALAAGALFYLGAYAKRELFFFKHNDTRYLCRVWVEDHVPDSFIVRVSAYTSSRDTPSMDPESAMGYAHVFSDRVRVTPPPNAVSICSFTLETEKLSQFRNWNQHVFITAPDHVRAGSRRPAFQPIPSPHPRTMLFEDAPWWVRSEKAWDVYEGDRLSGSIASDLPLREALWLIRAGEQPCMLELSLGKKRARLQLKAHETRVLTVSDLRETCLTRTIRHFYPWRIRARSGSARVILATTLRDMAWSYFNAGCYQEAWNTFERIDGKNRSPGDDIARTISGLLTGALSTDQAAAVETGRLEDMLKAYGVSTAFLETLPGQSYGPDTLIPRSISASDAPRKPFIPARIPGSVLRDAIEESQPPGYAFYAETPAFRQEPGHYQVVVRGSAPHLPLTLELVAHGERIIRSVSLDADKETHTIPFVVDHQEAGLRVRLRGSESALHRVEGVMIQPQPSETLAEYKRLLTAMTTRRFPEDPFSALAYLPLKQLGDHYADQQEETKASEIYIAAIRAAPWRMGACERLDSISARLPQRPADFGRILEPFLETRDLRRIHPVSVTMRNSMTLTGYQITADRVRAGEPFGLRLCWDTPRPCRRTEWHTAWIHGIPEGEDAPAFFGDWGLMDVLSLQSDKDLLIPHFIEVVVPFDAPPGNYTIKTGLWIPAHSRTIRVRDANIPHERRGVFLTEIEVIP